MSVQNPFDLLDFGNDAASVAAPIPGPNTQELTTTTVNSSFTPPDPFEFGPGRSSFQAPAPPPAAAPSKWPSMLEKQWSTGCNSRQQDRNYIIICAKQCLVPGGIETLIRSSNTNINVETSGQTQSYARNEHMILQMGASRNACYPDTITNPVTGSLGNKARSLAGRLTKGVKGAVDLAERNISSMAIKYSTSAPAEIMTAVVLVSQPIHKNYPGSAKFEEFDKTESKKLEEGEDEVVWTLPVILPPPLPKGPDHDGKDRMIQIRVQMKSSAALTSKQYLVGSATFSLSEFVEGEKLYFSAPLQSTILTPGSGASLDVFVVRNRKYPPLGGVGWSLTDPIPDVCGALNAPFTPPLEQLYALRDVNNLEASFPKSVCLVVERTQESSMVLPISTAVTRLLAEAAMHSARHADSVARCIKSNALRFRDPVEALDENRHAECILDLCHLTRFDSPHSQQQSVAQCQVRVALQAPDCVFERPICASHLPIRHGQAGVNNNDGPARIHTTFPFYPKRHPDQTGKKVTLGMLRMEVRIGAEGNQSSPTNSGGPMIWEGYAEMDSVLDKPGGVFMEVPMFATYPTQRMVATLMVKLSARSPPQRQSGHPTSGQTLLSPNKGLLSLFNMDCIIDGMLDNSKYDPSLNNKLGDFYAMDWMEEHSKKRHLDAGTLVSRYECYKLALTRPDPGLATLPVYQRKFPSCYRPSSSKSEIILSGIPFNTHVQAVVLEPLVASQAPPRAWHNITCGAAADHARGFTSANDKPGGAGGVRRLDLRREECERLLKDALQQLQNAVAEYLAKFNGRRRHVPVDEPYVAHHRAACFRAAQRLAELNWEVAKRRGNLLSQVLGQAITAYLSAVSDVTRSNDSTAQLWIQHGFLLCYEGLLSAAGKETAMIEDAFSAIELLQHVQVELVDASIDALGERSIKVVGSRVIRSIELVRHNDSYHVTPTQEAPLVDLLGGMTIQTPAAHMRGQTPSIEGEGGDLVVRIAIDSSFYKNRIPASLRNGTRVRFYAMLFQMGVDIMQWGANATSKISQTQGQPVVNRQASTNSSENGSGLEDEDDADGGVDEDNDLLVALNNEAFRKLNKYAFKIKPTPVGDDSIRIANGAGGMDVVHPMLNRLWTNILDSAKKMEHGVLDAAGAAAETLGGSGVIFCKSGKDRTAMQATLKQSLYLAKVGVRPADQASILQDATLMRMYGTRLPVCEKNVGQPKYAFNALQVKFMPEKLKPPLESLAGFLKGGSIFSRAGAIES